ncbi:hypothetical protein IJF91_00370 [Candidatus Saccharibacteria bacterium]|nr:hypothetical protein [Candidatus Saccharibacteria bacterium]
MLSAGLISWWYKDGFKLFAEKIWTKLGDTVDFFSIGSLLGTLFAPYRQISANASGTSIDAKFMAFLDRLVSRLVGGVARIGIIIFGIIVIFLQLIVSLVSLIFWPLLPVIPIICIFLSFSGVTIWLK